MIAHRQRRDVVQELGELSRGHPTPPLLCGGLFLAVAFKTCQLFLTHLFLLLTLLFAAFCLPGRPLTLQIDQYELWCSSGPDR